MNSAILSDCGAYRYRLDRDVQSTGPTYMFVGIHPSTADHEVDDATVRKWKGFTNRLGGKRFVVANLFAFRSTAVERVAKAEDPFGPDNAWHMAAIAGECDIIVPCWGSRNKVPKSLAQHIDYSANHLAITARKLNKPMLCWGTTASGDPRHPLMLAYNTPLEPFKPRS